MVALLLVYSYIFFVLLGMGILSTIGMHKLKWFEVDYFKLAPDYLIIIGLIILTVILAFYNIFLPINWITNLIVIGIVYGLIIVNREIFQDIIDNYMVTFKRYWETWTISILIFFPILFIVVLFSVQKIQSFDTGLYHAQYIQWIEKYRTPPGLVWIHSRFAFNSHFHLVSAFFSFSTFDFKNSNLDPLVFYSVNGFLFLVFSLRSIFKIVESLKIRDVFTAALYSGILFCPFCIFGYQIQSPTVDSVVAILIFYVFLIYLENIHFSTEWTFHQVLLILMILMLPTYKLSAGLIVLLIVPLVWRKSLKDLRKLIVPGLLVVAPFFIRNIIISGYMIYSLPQIDFFSFEWKFSSEDALTDNAVIKAWARIPYENYQKVLAMPFSEWFPVWWSVYGFDLNKIVLKVCLISPLLMAIAFWLDRKNFSVNKLIIAIVLQVNLIFWFISAPDPRFAWGFIYFNFAMTLALLAATPKFKYAAHLAGIIIFYFAYKSLWYTSESWSLLVTPKAIHDVQYFPKQIEYGETRVFSESSFLLFTPVKDDGRCFNAPVPCTPYPLRRVRMRGESLADGFIYDTTIP